jgi:hypothetical protein
MVGVDSIVGDLRERSRIQIEVRVVGLWLLYDEV